MAAGPGSHVPRLLVAALLAATFAMSPRVAEAQQQQAPPACEGPEFEAFDYWVGAWSVRNAEGREVGTNRVSKVSGGCGLLEEWESSTGNTGKSLNFYEPRSGDWRQVWVGAGGSILDLRGGLVDGVMTLSSEGPDPRGGTVRQRISWIPREGGVVEQFWEMARGDDDWTVAFQGFYHPMGG